MRVSLTASLCAPGQPAPPVAATAAGAPSAVASAVPPNASIGDLVQLPDHALVTIRGKLENVGKSLFDRTRHIVLTDDKGNSVDVKVNTPIQTALPPGASDRRPTALSQILGQDVVVTGMLHQSGDGGSKPRHIELSTVTAAPH